MLSALTASLAETMVLGLQIARMQAGWSPEVALRLELLQVIAIFVGLMAGTAGLVLTSFVYRWRVVRPPAVIAMFAVTVCLLPYISLLARWLR